MDDSERLKRAMAEMEEGVRGLVREAARLTAEGVDTSGLAASIAKMREAIGELGEVDGRGKKRRGATRRLGRN